MAFSYERNTEDHFTNSDPLQLWQGIQDLINHKTSHHMGVDMDTFVVEEFNHFITHFEVEISSLRHVFAPAERPQQSHITHTNPLQPHFHGART